MTSCQIQVLIDKKLEIEPGETLLSSASYPWSGFLIEHHWISETEQYYSFWQVPRPHIILILEGEGDVRWYAGGKYHNHFWRPGYIFLLNQDYELRSLEYRGTPRSYIVAEISRSKLVHTAPDDSYELCLDFVHHAIGRNQQAEALMRAMYREVIMGCPCGKLYAESMSLALASHLSSYYAAHKPEQYQSYGITQTQLNYIVDYIHDNLATHITLLELADVIKVSPFRLCKRFKEVMGVTPYRYILEQRIERAKSALTKLSDTDSITDIALSLGFCSHSHFSSTFHKSTGMSPYKYRQQIKNKT